MGFAWECFEDEGSISRQLGSYESRTQQIEMVKAVEETIMSEKHLLVEAGPGVGKSLAYLVPFIYWAVTENKRAVVSTYTKALQNQLFIKDLPFLKGALDLDFKYALCLGSSNYLCVEKMYKLRDSFPTDPKHKDKQIQRVLQWAGFTHTGLISDMDFVPDNRVWEHFRRESDLCRGRKCRNFGNCFYMKARDEQSGAHLLVANHALLFSSLAPGNNIFPDFHGLVLDEAHTVEDVATEYFGSEFSVFGIQALTGKIISFLESSVKASKNRALISEEVSDVERGCSDLIVCSEIFFKEFSEKVLENKSTTEFDPGVIGYKDIYERAGSLQAALTELSAGMENDVSETAYAYAQRVSDLRGSISRIFTDPPENVVLWAQSREFRSGKDISIHASPIDVSGYIKENIFKCLSTAVVTSATLSASVGARDLSFVRDRLGMDDALELILSSPFDYYNNVLMYIPPGIPDPNSDLKGFTRALKDNILSVFDVMKGRIFALFTSYSMIESVFGLISSERPEVKILKQGDMPRYVLLDVFKKNKDSILMGTSTFWQGVDVPGDSLECVIITRLPFGVPSDPVNAARIRHIRARGGDPFSEYQIPRALMMFKQGFGRLIRSRSDRGIFAVLDPRVISRGYGKVFLDHIPDCPSTEKISDVREFFELKNDNQGITKR